MVNNSRNYVNATGLISLQTLTEGNQLNGKFDVHVHKWRNGKQLQ